MAVWTTIGCVAIVGFVLKGRTRELYIALVVALVGLYIVAEAALRAANDDRSGHVFLNEGYGAGVAWYQDMAVGGLLVIGSIGYLVSAEKRRRKSAFFPKSPGKDGQRS